MGFGCRCFGGKLYFDLVVVSCGGSLVVGVGGSLVVVILLTFLVWAVWVAVFDFLCALFLCGLICHKCCVFDGLLWLC